MDLLEEDILSDHELKIDDEVSGYLMETTKWAKIISVIIYSLIAITVVGYILFDRFKGGVLKAAMNYYGRRHMPYPVVMGVFIILILFAIVIFYFLLNFSNKIKAGIKTDNIKMVNKGFQSLKIHFAIIGVLLGSKLLYVIYQMVVK